MRRPRVVITDSPSSCYHAVGRIAGDLFLLESEAVKDRFVAYMRLYERFCGVRVLTYCVMSNHFHILVEVPKRPDQAGLTQEWLVAHVTDSMGPAAGRALEVTLTQLRQSDQGNDADLKMESYFRMMWDLSAFMKAVKQRFTQWYNGTHRRRGTMWEARFKSVLVEGTEEVLAMMAAYIDLNPVRADIVNDPKDFRWSGYGTAVAGDSPSQAGLREIFKNSGASTHGKALPMKEVLSRYRCHLYPAERVVSGATPVSKGRARLKPEAVAEVQTAEDDLSTPDFLRARVRHFTEGGVVGSREFVEARFHDFRQNFGRKRKTGARPLRMMPKDGRLFAWRDLK
jgi:putative transposase